MEEFKFIHFFKLKKSFLLLHSKRDFSDIIQLRILDEEIILCYLGGPNIITREQEGQRPSLKKKEVG